MFFNITEETHGFESSNNIKPQHPVFSLLGADPKHAYTCSQYSSVIYRNRPVPLFHYLQKCSSK